MISGSCCQCLGFDLVWENWAPAASPFGTTGALIIRRWLGGIIYSNHSQEPPKPYSNYCIKAPAFGVFGSGLQVALGLPLGPKVSENWGSCLLKQASSKEKRTCFSSRRAPTPNPEP